VVTCPTAVHDTPGLNSTIGSRVLITKSTAISQAAQLNNFTVVPMSTQPSILHGTIKYVCLFWPSNAKLPWRVQTKAEYNWLC